MPGTHPELAHTRPPGRPTLLSPEVKARLIETLKLGVPIKTACEAAGIHVNTFGRWMQRGYSEHEAQAAECEPDEVEAPFLDLYLAVSEARSQAAVRNVGLVQKAAQGGYVTKVTEKKYKDVETGRIVTEVTEDRAGPDWRAAAWYLERVHKDEFGKDAVQVEVTGGAGHGITVGQVVEDLSARLAAHLAENQAVAAIAATQVPASETDVDEDKAVDAELVD